MKHLTLLFAFMTTATFTSFADHNSSIFNLMMHKNLPYSVIMDDDVFETGDNSIRLEEVYPGDHLLKVIQHLPQYGTTGHRVIFEGPITIAPASDVYAVIDHTGLFSIYNVVPLVPVMNIPVSPCGKFCNGHHVSQHELNLLLYAIDREHEGEEQQEVAKHGMKHRTFSVAQVRQILGVVRSEKRRVKVAKKAWKRTCDKHNFTTLFDMFHKHESIEKLMEHMYDDD